MEGQHAEDGLDRTVTARSDNPNVFDDEYAVDTPTSPDFNISDGFRTGTGAAQDSQPGRTSRSLSTPAINTLDAKVAPAPSRSSIQKPRDVFGGFAMGNDTTQSSSGQTPHITNAVATPFADLPHRSSSRASSSYATTADRSSVLQQQSGPSFPYSLYQQNGMGNGRSPSIATTSTAQPGGRTSVLHRPAHPYGLYSQNGLDEGGDPVSVQQSIPVGLGGRSDGFHRQLGPDGEEQDIVGPDGHTEQLPPYSKYPEEGSAKVTAPATSLSQDSLTRDVTTSSQPQPQPSASASTAQMLSDGNDEGEPEKRWNEKTWKEKRKTKVCGGRLPCSIFAIMVVVAVLVIALIAGLVGGLVAAEKKANDNVVTTTLFDASLISAPTGVPGPPVGQWALPLGIPEEQQSGCLTDPSQSNAWTCAQNGPPLLLSVNSQSGGGQIVGSAQLGDIDPQDNGFNYGTQPPMMHISPLEWVIDLDNPNLGPALHFQAYYNKQVIVNDNDFSGNPSRLLRRNGNKPSPGGDQFHRKGRVNAGDTPWQCFWNATFLEGFIYMQENSTDAMSQSSQWASMTAKHGSSNSTQSQAPSTPPSATSQPTSSVSFNMADITPPPGMPSSQFASWLSSYSSSLSASAASAASASANNRKRATTMTTSTTTTPPPSVYTVVASGTDSGTITKTSYTVPTKLPLFPHIMKVEERRMGMAAGPAICVKMELLGDDQLVPYIQNGQGVNVTLSESDPNESQFEGKSQQTKKRKLKRGYRRMWDMKEVEFEAGTWERDVDEEPADSCHCQWKNS